MLNDGLPENGATSGFAGWPQRFKNSPARSVRFRHRNEMKTPALLAITATLILVASASSQSVTAPVARFTGDVYSAASPNDGTRRFALDTGHFGRFYNCDCEEAKRNSPYIHWQTVNRCETRRTGWGVFCHDLDEVKARVRAGRCCPTCWPDWLCPDCDCDCAEGCGVGTNQGLILATLPPEWRGGRTGGYGAETEAPARDAASPTPPAEQPGREDGPPTGPPAGQPSLAPSSDDATGGQVTSHSGPRIVRAVGFHSARRAENDSPTRR